MVGELEAVQKDCQKQNSCRLLVVLEMTVVVS